MDNNQNIAEEMYRKHKATSRNPCKTFSDFVAEFKEDIYYEIIMKNGETE